MMDIVKQAYDDYMYERKYRDMELEARGEYRGRKIKLELEHDLYSLFFKWRVVCAVYGDELGDLNISRATFRKYEKARDYFMYLVKKYNLTVMDDR